MGKGRKEERRVMPLAVELVTGAAHELGISEGFKKKKRKYIIHSTENKGNFLLTTENMLSLS